MTPSLLRPQAYLSNKEVLELAQQAPNILRNNPKAFSTSPLVSLFTASETPELWMIYENLLIACLRTGDDQSAFEILERLIQRFGGENERIMALKGLAKEAKAANNAELEAILKEYDSLLSGQAESETNIPVAKRRIALLKSIGRKSEAIASLVKLLDYSPTDAEGWSELSDLYLSQGLYAQAIYALEEVLVLQANSWNMHARLGEILYMAATELADGSSNRYFAESVKRFCRSIELCDDYLRGYYGLKQVTGTLLSDPKLLKPSKQADGEGMALPPKKTLEALNEKATAKLGEIVRRYSTGDVHWQGYDAAEIEATRQLLAKDEAQVVR
ncbi:Tetratricopeptide repeat domain-containing protein [Scedosporium apiospermum]|uniref:ER membrane protein complex subunit 2 n=1 Tax=Pseudallescheria apiosperma TaxID=563466 RepID=A0A084FXA7_PSEDA|nr:Tetratricopeptide repeat domain-containing protein [Scedosporium apiospermum]KEZ39719.1 Tetratricopeptide repeat domain-containing protein [Scedosporium apiospermum]